MSSRAFITPSTAWQPATQCYFVMVFSDLATYLLDLCYILVIIAVDKEVIPVGEGAAISMGMLKTILTKNEPMGREDWRVVLKKLVGVLAPSAQPYRAAGKGSPARGTGPRLTDRKRYK